MSNPGVENYISREMKLRILRGETPTWMLGHIRSRYIIDSTLAAPLWVHRRDFRELREKAKFLDQLCGEPHVLDHIVPISHPYVCGLTVPWNMQVIPKRVNASKGNQWHPDQLPFDLGGQLTLL